jgi:hypothetical protein
MKNVLIEADGYVFSSAAIINTEKYVSLDLSASPLSAIPAGAFYCCASLSSVTFQRAIPSSGFSEDAFPGDLRDKFYATDEANGTPGTYTKKRRGKKWKLN